MPVRIFDQTGPMLRMVDTARSSAVSRVGSPIVRSSALYALLTSLGACWNVRASWVYPLTASANLLAASVEGAEQVDAAE